MLRAQRQHGRGPSLDHERHRNQRADPTGKEPVADRGQRIGPGDVRADDDLSGAQRASREAGVGSGAVADLQALWDLVVLGRPAHATFHPRPTAARIDDPYRRAEEAAEVDRQPACLLQQLVAVKNAHYGGVDGAVYAHDPRETLELLALPAHLRLRAQGVQAEGQIGCQLLQKLELGTIEGIRTIGVDAKSADALALEEQRQGHGRSIACAFRIIAPGREVGIGVDLAAHLDATLADGTAGGTLTPLIVAPTDVQPLEIVALMTGVCGNAHVAGGRPIGEAEPGEPVAAGADEDAADIGEQLLLVLGAGERALAGDQHAQLAIGLREHGFGAGRLPCGIRDALVGRRHHNRRTNPPLVFRAYYTVGEGCATCRTDRPPRGARSGPSVSIRDPVHVFSVLRGRQRSCAARYAAHTRTAAATARKAERGSSEAWGPLPRPRLPRSAHW